MTRLGRLAAVALLAFGTVGCITMRVASQLEPGADLSQFRTWDWGQPDGLPTGDARLDNNTFFTDRLKAAVESAMSARGFLRVPQREQPDLIVHYHTNFTQRFQVNEPDSSCVPPNCRASVMDYDQGTLVLDVVNGRTSKLLWRGWAEDSMNGVIENQDRMDAQVNEAVTKIMALFPRALL